MKLKIMHPRFLALILIAFISATKPSSAHDSDASGITLYKNTVSAAKLHVQPEERSDFQGFDPKEALKTSQGAIGNQLGDYTFLSSNGQVLRLSDYRGKPLVIDMIYTHCPFVCEIKTRNLDALKLSREAFGNDSFAVLTIGFDSANDTPEAMGNFIKRIRMDTKLPNWEFVSADADTIKNLSKDLGFVFTPSPNGGFDHITQTTFIDGKGKVYQHVYGEEFDNKTLLEPLKNMIYNIKANEPGLVGLSNKVRFFCTVYDAQTGKYNIDYSYFYGIGFGILISLFITWWIVSEYHHGHKQRKLHDA